MYGRNATRHRRVGAPPSLPPLLLVALMVAFAGSAGQTLAADPAKAAFDQAAGRQERLNEARKSWKESHDLAENGKLDEAVGAARKVIAIEREVFGEEHEELTTSLEWLAQLDVRRGDLAAACQTRRLLLTLQRKLYGAEHWRATDTRLALADLERQAAFSRDERQMFNQATQRQEELIAATQEGQFDKAIMLNESLLDAWKELFGREHLRFADALWSQGLLYGAAGKTDQALGSFQQATDLFEKILGREHPGFADRLHELGRRYQASGQAGAAESSFRRAWDVRTNVLGLKHASSVDSFLNLAAVILGRQFEQLPTDPTPGQLASAVDLLRALLVDVRRVFGARDEHVCMLQTPLADLYIRQGDFASARAARREILSILTEIRGEKHWEVADARLESEKIERMSALTAAEQLRLARAEQAGSQAAAYYARGDYGAGLKCADEAVTIYRDLLGEKSRDHAQSLASRGALHLAAYNLDRAEKDLVQAGEVLRELLGNDHPEYAAALNNFGSFCKERGEYELAATFFEGTCAILQHSLGPRTTRYAAALNNYGDILRIRGQLDAAAKCFQQACQIQEALTNRDDPNYATFLHNLALVHEDRAQYSVAQELLEETLRIRQKALTERHPDYWKNLRILGSLHQSQGDYGRAEERFLQAKELMERFGAKDTADYLLCQQSLGAFYVAVGRYRDARRQLEDALARSVRMGRVIHPDHASLLAVSADLSLRTADYPRALHDCRQAQTIKERVWGKSHGAYAMGLQLLGRIQEALGESELAANALDEAIDIQRRALGDLHPELAVLLIDRANVAMAQGEFQRSKDLFERALKIIASGLGDRHPRFADCQEGIARLEYELGNYAEAIRRYRAATAVYGQSLDDCHPAVLASRVGLAKAYHAVGDLATAEKQFVSVLEAIAKSPGDSVRDAANVSNELGLLYWERGQGDRAATLLRAAAEQTRRLLGEAHLDYAASLNNLGLVLFEMQDDAGARQAFLRASEIYEHAAAQKHLRYATLLNNLASVATRQRDQAAAESYFRRAVDVARDAGGPEHPEYARCLSNLGSFYDAQNRPELAEPALLEALHVIRRNLDLAAGGQSERQQLLMLRSLRFRLDNYLAFSARAPAPPEQAYDQLLAWKGAVFARQSRLRMARDQTELAPLFEQLQTVTGRLATLTCALPAPDQRAAWREQSAALAQRKDELESELATQCAAFQQQRRASRLTSAELRAALPPDTALVDLLEYNRRGLAAERADTSTPGRNVTAFVVRREGPIVRIELGPAAPIEQAVEEWRRTFGEGEEGKQAAEELRMRVWLPLQEQLSGVKMLLISPDGALARFPFAALPIDEAGHCMIERLPLAVVPVPQLLPERRAIQAKSRSAEAGTTDPADVLLLLGDVDFAALPGRPDADQRGREPSAETPQRGGGGRFAPLPGFAQEFQLIRDRFQNNRPGGRIHELRQTAATEEAFRRLAPDSVYLHLITHGFFAPAEMRSLLSQGTRTDRGLSMLTTTGPNNAAGGEAPGGLHPGLLSGIALAGANRNVDTADAQFHDDGILRAMEVAQMDLGAAELVVLSACETALGEAAGGEGLMGLQRAFQVAGARTVVASLWKVDDAATELLMERFYLNLWEKRLAKLDALRETQLWMLNGADGQLAERLAEKSSDVMPPRRLSARYWAAFVLSGDWR